jgi:hypothetical protein
MEGRGRRGGGEEEVFFWAETKTHDINGFGAAG